VKGRVGFFSEIPYHVALETALQAEPGQGRIKAFVWFVFDQASVLLFGADRSDSHRCFQVPSSIISVATPLPNWHFQMANTIL
jgi:hypothetical protein